MLREACQVRFHQIWSQEASQDQTLLMQLSVHNFLFVTINPDNTFAELSHVSFDRPQEPLQLTELLGYLLSNFRLQRRFGRVEVCWSGTCTLIPEAFASAEAEVLSFVSDTSSGRVKAQVYDNVSFAYQFDAELLSTLERVYPNLVVRHSAPVFSELFNSQLQFNTADALLHVSDYFIELLVKQNGSLSFYNQFRFETDEDILYYILFSLEQLHMEPLKTSLFFAGERMADSALVKDLRNYLGRVQPAERFGEQKALQPPHFYYLLTQQQLCES